MIIWGSKVREDQLSLGQFFCPNCKDDAPYKRVRTARYFTLYFIPLFVTEDFGETVRCGRCRQDFRTVVLTHSREQILATLAPWPCGGCGNLNPVGAQACVACSTARDAVAPVAASVPA
jgi:hypothetical protein